MCQVTACKVFKLEASVQISTYFQFFDWKKEFMEQIFFSPGHSSYGDSTHRSLILCTNSKKTLHLQAHRTWWERSVHKKDDDTNTLYRFQEEQAHVQCTYASPIRKTDKVLSYHQKVWKGIAKMNLNPTMQLQMMQITITTSITYEMS